MFTFKPLLNLLPALPGKKVCLKDNMKNKSKDLPLLCHYCLIYTQITSNGLCDQIWRVSHLCDYFMFVMVNQVDLERLCFSWNIVIKVHNQIIFKTVPCLILALFFLLFVVRLRGQFECGFCALKPKAKTDGDK